MLKISGKFPYKVIPRAPTLLSEVEFTNTSLDLLVLVYFGTMGWIEKSDVSDTELFGGPLFFLVDCDLLHVDSVRNDYINVYSLGKPLPVEKVLSGTRYTLSVTELGKQMVESLGLVKQILVAAHSRLYGVVEKLAVKLSVKDLPELLASDSSFLRGIAREVLAAEGGG